MAGFYSVACADCNVAQALNKLTDNNCGKAYYPVSRLIFEGADAAPVLLTDIPLIATWQAFLAAPTNDPEKRAITQVGRIYNEEFVGAAGLEISTNLSGIAIKKSFSGRPKLTVFLKDLLPDQIREYHLIKCWASRFWIVNTNDEIVGYQVDATHATGFPMYENNIWINNREKDGGNGEYGTKKISLEVMYQDPLFETNEIYTSAPFARYGLIQI